MMRASSRVAIVGLMLGGLLLGPASAQAIPITVDGGWVSFTFDSGETGGPWTFTAPAGGVVLTITDRYVYGERWDVYDGASYLGATSVAPLGGGSCEGNVTNCFADPNTSKGFFNLGAGARSITMQQIAGGSTSGSLRVESVVPEPGTAVLLATGLLGLALRRRGV